MRSVSDEFSIVVIGKWNVTIFNNEWLSANVFGERELSIEFPMDPGLPRIITCDNVRLIPAYDRLVVRVTDLNRQNLDKAEETVCKLLDLLPHTPVAFTGINFGYEEEPDPPLLQHFPYPDEDHFNDLNRELELLSREYRLNFKTEDHQLSLKFMISTGKIRFIFNCHFVTETCANTKDVISGKVSEMQSSSLAILQDVYGLTLEVLDG